MRSNQIHLQVFELGLLDNLVGEVTEAGVDSINDFVALSHHVIDDLPTFLNFVPTGGREVDPRVRVAGQLHQFLGGKGLPIKQERVRHFN